MKVKARADTGAIRRSICLQNAFARLAGSFGATRSGALYMTRTAIHGIRLQVDAGSGARVPPLTREGDRRALRRLVPRRIEELGCKHAALVRDERNRLRLIDL